MREKRIIILKQWKFVARAALQIIKHFVIHLIDFWLVWKLLNIEHYPLSSSMERLAH